MTVIALDNEAVSNRCRKLFLLIEGESRMQANISNQIVSSKIEEMCNRSSKTVAFPKDFCDQISGILDFFVSVIIPVLQSGRHALNALSNADEAIPEFLGFIKAVFRQITDLPTPLQDFWGVLIENRFQRCGIQALIDELRGC
jgi:hypothetical protein